MTLVCSFLPVSCKIAITIFDTITIRYPTTSDFCLSCVAIHAIPCRNVIAQEVKSTFFLSISSIQILHTNSSKLQTKSRSFIDYNDQSNNPERTVYLYDSFLHMSRDFISIIDVIVFFSHKTLIRCHFNFSIVEFSCDGKVTVHVCAYLTSVSV